MSKGSDVNLRARNAKAPSRVSFNDYCGGLFLNTSKAGTKSWRVGYFFHRQFRMAVLGYYPEMTPSEARTARLDIRAKVSAGVDPVLAQRVQKAAALAKQGNTVDQVATDWLSWGSRLGGWSAGYAVQVERRLAKHVLPKLGTLPVDLVTAQDIQTVIDRLEKELGQHAQAVHVRQHLQCLFDYARDHKFVAENIVRTIGRWLPQRKRGDVREQKQPRVGTIEEARQILQAMEAATASPFLKLAHRLIALTAVRKMEAVDATWSELDDAMKTWTIPGERMKGRRGHQEDHVIPLTIQAAQVFQAARALADVQGIKSERVFPVMNRTSLNDMMTRVLPVIGLDGKHTLHGWRGTFSTLQNTEDPGAEMIIEVMLAHKTKSNVAGRYNDSKYLAARLEIARKWSDKLLDGMPSAFQVAGIKQQGNVVPFRQVA